MNTLEEESMEITKKMNEAPKELEAHFKKISKSVFDYGTEHKVDSGTMYNILLNMFVQFSLNGINNGPLSRDLIVNQVGEMLDELLTTNKEESN